MWPGFERDPRERPRFVSRPYIVREPQAPTGRPYQEHVTVPADTTQEVPPNEDHGAGWRRIPGLADGAAPVPGRARGGGAGQLRPPRLRQRAGCRVAGADRTAADQD